MSVHTKKAKAYNCRGARPPRKKKKIGQNGLKS